MPAVAKRVAACLGFAAVLVLSLARPAFADQLPQGMLYVMEDVWSTGIITNLNADELPASATGDEAPIAASGGEQTASSESGTGDSSGSPAQSAGGSSSVTAAPAAPSSELASDAITQHSTESQVATTSEPLSYDNGSIVAELAPGSSRESLNGIITEASERGLKLSGDAITPADLEFGVVRLGIADGTSPLDAISVIAQVKGIVSAQLNYLYSCLEWDEGTAFSEVSGTAAGTSNTLSTQTFTQVSDRLTNDYWAADAVNIRGAWDLAKAQGSVAVAVVDTGIYKDHFDLKGRVVATYNAVTGTDDANDLIGHGTHVAGIIAGTANNGVGIAGNSYNANLVAIKASAADKNTFDTAAIVAAYAWLLSTGEDGLTVAQRYNVRVVNLSIGGKDDTLSAARLDDKIVAAMLEARRAGILTIAAAGNKGASEDPYLTYPGDTDVCLSVMNLSQVSVEPGSDEDGHGAVVTKVAAPSEGGVGTLSGYDLSSTSNYNTPGTRYKDVCAPGTNIGSTWRRDASKSEDIYVEQSGTSMATPLVSGIAALMFAANPHLTPADVMTLIELTCVDLGDEGWDERYGYGLVDAAAAVRAATDLAIEGPSFVGVGMTSSLLAITGSANQADESGWSWEIAASADTPGVQAELVWEDGAAHVRGISAGDVIVRATCRAVNGAELGVQRVIHVVEAVLSGAEELALGESASFAVKDATTGEATLFDANGWAWMVDEGCGYADVDANGVLTALRSGIITVRAVSTIDYKLSFSKQLYITA